MTNLVSLLREARASVARDADADCVCADGPQRCKYCRPIRALLERIDLALSTEPALCQCGKPMGEHPAQPPWWPCMLADKSACPYCERPADGDGSIFHANGCAGLESVELNRLQYDALVSRAADKPGEQAAESPADPDCHCKNPLTGEFYFDKCPFHTQGPACPRCADSKVDPEPIYQDYGNGPEAQPQRCKACSPVKPQWMCSVCKMEFLSVEATDPHRRLSPDCFAGDCSPIAAVKP